MITESPLSYCDVSLLSMGHEHNGPENGPNSTLTLIVHRRTRR